MKKLLIVTIALATVAAVTKANGKNRIYTSPEDNKSLATIVAGKKSATVSVISSEGIYSSILLRN